MAFRDDLQSIIENLISNFDPTIDLTQGSPFQLKFVQPLLDRMAVDPFDTDVATFVRDQLVQAFPQLASDGGGGLEDLFTSPMKLLLSPFRREIEDVKIGQSVLNGDIMSDDQADALGANFFLPRRGGGQATTPVRLYFAGPVSQTVTPDKRCSTAGGVSFFPTQTFNISSTQMLFNREGNLYFMDILVRCDTAGEVGNVAAGEIDQIDGVPAAVKVANLSDVTTGVARESNPEYFTRVQDSLSENSLVVRRGIATRLPDLFDNIRALQVVGAGDSGMDRDILTGTSEGRVYAGCSGIIYGSWVYIEAAYQVPGMSGMPAEGDIARGQLDPQVDPARTVHEAKIVKVLPMGPPPSSRFLFVLDRELPNGDSIFLLLKPGFITISGVPGGQGTLAQGVTGLEVPDGQVHLGGHSDVFLRPMQDSTSTAVFENLTDERPIAALTTVDVQADSNLIETNDPTIRAQAGDILVIESGVSSVGSYSILNVGAPDAVGQLRIDTLLSATEVGLRARIVRGIRLDLVEPKIPRLPFDATSMNDLSTVVGSSLFRLNTDSLLYGAAVGDTLRVQSGADTGDYLIAAFDNVLGGKGLVVDRPATASGANLSYRIFKKGTGLSLPLVKIRSLEVLDSNQQGTGITIPYGDAVDVRPTCDFDGAGREVQVLDRQLFILPDMKGLWETMASDAPANNATLVNSDCPYSLGLKPIEGFMRRLSMNAANPIKNVEVDFPPFMWNGRRDKLLALTTREDQEFPKVVHDNGGNPYNLTNFTSDVAKSKPGDSITILDGPCRGKYLIRDLRVFPLWSQNGAKPGRYEVALVQLDQELPLDPIRTARNLISFDFSQGGPVNPSSFPEDVIQAFTYASDFYNGLGFYTPFVAQLGLVFNHLGPGASAAQALLDNYAFCAYAVGPSARGTLRCYFQNPVSVEMQFQETPTVFQDASNPTRLFRLAPLPQAQIFPESETLSPASACPRDFLTRDPRVSSAGPTDNPIFLPEGTPFALRGIRSGDTFEYYPEINSFRTWGMTESSWLVVTQAGSNQVRVLLPKHVQDNEATPLPGTLLFIDSGPDAGAYTVTSVVSWSWPDFVVTVDRLMTHSTQPLPEPFLSGQAGLGNAVAITVGNNFAAPMPVNNKTLVVQLSADGGLTWESPRTHTFAANCNNAAAVVASINGHGAFVNPGGSQVQIQAAVAGSNNTEVSLAPVNGPFGFDIRLKIGRESTCLSVLRFDSGTYFGEAAFAGPGSKRIYHPVFNSPMTNVGDWITLYGTSDGPETLGNEAPFLGTFRVTGKGLEAAGAFSTLGYLELDRTSTFPGTVANRVLWVVHPQQISQTPAETQGGGRQISDQYVRARMYDGQPRRSEIQVPWLYPVSDPLVDPPGIDANPIQANTGSAPFYSQTQLILTSERIFGSRIPYRILREGILRVSSTTMANNRDGALYYLDVPAIGYGPGAEMNIPSNTPLVIAANARIEGYTYEVENPTLSYSVRERVSLILPQSVLPPGATASLDNKIRLSGQNVQALYDHAPLIDEVQSFVDAPQDRVVVANTLVRHFLPAYVFLDAAYVGGSSTDQVAKDLIAFINNIPPSNNRIRIDALQDLIKRRGASAVTLPMTVIALVYGADRRIRGIRSEDGIGEGDLPVFTGTYRQIYFIPGPNTSSTQVRPDGEQVFLVRS